MHRLLFAGLMVAFCGSASGATLESLRGEYRVIVVFTPTDTTAGEMIDELTRTDGFVVRDAVWFVLGPDTFESSQGTAIRRRTDFAGLRSGSGLEAILIGKDGGVKARQAEELDIAAFFDAIDQMPMRQREMQERGNE